MKSNNFKKVQARKKRTNGMFFRERMSLGDDPGTGKNFLQAPPKPHSGACDTVSIGNGDADEK
jgi:hypothetical protein